MAKNKNRTSGQKPKASHSQESSDAQPRTLPAAKPGASRWREWAVRLLLIFLSPTLFVLFLEFGLRLFGYGFPTTFFLKTADGKSYTTNRKFAWQFYKRETATQPHPFLMASEKEKGTRRIFILGESAAVGTPDPAFGFARILGVMLRRQYPTQRFEVINAAMRGINSHIVLPIARECAAHQPDLFIVYMGNNEAIGLHAPDPSGFNFTPHLGLLRALQWVKTTRTGQWLAATMARLRGGAGPKEKQDMEYFRNHRLAADAPRRKAVYDNFRANLEDVCKVTLNSGAKVLASTVAVNLKDFPPLASLHRADLSAPDKSRWETAYAAGTAAETRREFDQAIPRFEEAAHIDDHFADLQFRLGRCFLAMTNLAKAREHFTQARDWDAMQFRTDNRLNAIIREVATNKPTPGLQLVDAERAFADSPESAPGIPGEKLFYEHVHLRFAADYRLALTVLPQVAVSLGLGASAVPVPSRTECADELAFTGYD